LYEFQKADLAQKTTILGLLLVGPSLYNRFNAISECDRQTN